MAYTLQGHSGTVRFHDAGTVTKEQKKHKGKLTSYPIENNVKINDHYEKDASTGSISGILIGGGTAVSVLENMLDTADILTYTGSYRMASIVLTDLDFSTDSANKNGFSFTASYQQARIVGAQYIGDGDSQHMSEQDKGKSEYTEKQSKPAQNGLQTTASEAISSSGYAQYVDTFNQKPPPSPGPLSRTTPVYTGYR